MFLADRCQIMGKTLFSAASASPSSVIHSSIHSFNKYLPTASTVLFTILKPDTQTKQEKQGPLSLGLHLRKVYRWGLFRRIFAPGVPRTASSQPPYSRHVQVNQSSLNVFCSNPFFLVSPQSSCWNQSPTWDLKRHSLHLSSCNFSPPTFFLQN